MILIGIFLIVLAADGLFRIRQRNVVIQHQFRLYALRDALRELAMKKQVNKNNWVFKYLDSSITKSISALPHVSIWRTAVMIIFARKDTERLSLLYKEFEKLENEPLCKIYLHYVAEMGIFISNRHDTLWLMIKCITGILNMRKWLKIKNRRLKEVLTADAETSTLPDFCPS